MSGTDPERAADRSLTDAVVADFEALALRLAEAIERLPADAQADRQRLERAKENAERGAALARTISTERR